MSFFFLLTTGFISLQFATSAPSETTTVSPPSPSVPTSIVPPAPPAPTAPAPSAPTALPTPAPAAPQSIPSDACCSDLPQWESKLREMIWKLMQDPAAIADADGLAGFVKEFGITEMEELDVLTVAELNEVIKYLKTVKQRIVKKAIADATA